MRFSFWLQGAMMVFLLPSMYAWAEAIPKQTGSHVQKDQSSDKLRQCLHIQETTARLACFDEAVLLPNEANNTQKKPLDLSKTLSYATKFVGLSLGESHMSIDASNHQSFDDIYVDDTKMPDVALSGDTPLSQAFDLNNNNANLWKPRPHHANYILPLYFVPNPNRQPHTPNHPIHHYTPEQLRQLELQYQFSLKTKAAQNILGMGTDAWIAYTQKSHWQLYNSKHSHPFRTSDYQPEIFLTQSVVANLPYDGKLRLLGVGMAHHSNGEDDPLSRSWNRLYVMGGMEWGNLTIMPQVWVRLFHKIKRTKPNDNPDIVDYYGYGDVHFLYQMQGHRVAGMIRYNPLTHKGALQVDYTKPLMRGVNAYVQLFYGYGKSIVDYNKATAGIGVGIMLDDWAGL